MLSHSLVPAGKMDARAKQHEVLTLSFPPQYGLITHCAMRGG